MNMFIISFAEYCCHGTVKCHIDRKGSVRTQTPFKQSGQMVDPFLVKVFKNLQLVDILFHVFIIFVNTLFGLMGAPSITRRWLNYPPAPGRKTCPTCHYGPRKHRRKLFLGTLGSICCRLAWDCEHDVAPSSTCNITHRRHVLPRH